MSVQCDPNLKILEKMDSKINLYLVLGGKLTTKENCILFLEENGPIFSITYTEVFVLLKYR